MNTKKKGQIRKDRHAELLKKEILEAAIEVFKEYGFEKATTKKIAQKAEVSEGTLYNYFKNKRDILLNLFTKIKENTFNNRTILPGSEGDISKILSASLALQFKQNSTLPLFTLLLHEAGHDPDIRKVFLKQIKAIRKSRIDFYKQFEKTGKVRKINAATMAILINVITIGYTVLRESGDKELAKIPIKNLANEITDILVNDLAATVKKKGKAEFKDEILRNQTLS